MSRFVFPFFVLLFLSFLSSSHFHSSVSHALSPPSAHSHPLLLALSSDASYVEQLGTFMPIEAPQAGELVAFLVDEGSPVEYRQPVAEIVPFFGGHIIGDSKHA